MVQFGWSDLPVEEALELGLADAARTKYEAFFVGLFGYGITFAVRPKVPV